LIYWMIWIGLATMRYIENNSFPSFFEWNVQTG